MQVKSKQSRNSGLRKTMLGCDRHAENFQLKVDQDGSSSLPTCAGSVLSLLVLLTMAVYTAYKVNILLTFANSQMVQYTIEDHFVKDSEFTAKQGLEIAVGFLGGEQGVIDPKYGEISFQIISYDSLYGVYLKKIESHVCTNAELGQLEDQGGTKMMPMKKAVRDSLLFTTYFCIDSNQTALKGSQAASQFSEIVINIERCSNKDICMNDDAITEYFKGSAVTLIYNKIRFDSQRFGKDAIFK